MKMVMYVSGQQNLVNFLAEEQRSSSKMTLLYRVR